MKQIEHDISTLRTLIDQMPSDRDADAEHLLDKVNEVQENFNTLETSVEGFYSSTSEVSWHARTK